MTLLPFRTSRSAERPSTARAWEEQRKAEAAYRILVDETEKIRVGELPPSRRVLRQLARQAELLAKTDAMAIPMVADTLAVAHANLHAAHVDDTPEGEVVAELSEHLLEEAHPDQDPGSLEFLEAQAKKWAINHTTPERSFDVAHELGWERMQIEYGWQYDNNNGTITPPLEPQTPKSHPKTGRFDPFAEDEADTL